MTQGPVPTKPLSYEEIAKRYDITPAKVHTVIKSAYNKMIAEIMKREEISIFDAVLMLKKYFGHMSEKEAFEKLDDEHKKMITEFAAKEFEIREPKVKGKKKK
jgi:predicted transcriptional regulator